MMIQATSNLNDPAAMSGGRVHSFSDSSGDSGCYAASFNATDFGTGVTRAVVKRRLPNHKIGGRRADLRTVRQYADMVWSSMMPSEL